MILSRLWPNKMRPRRTEKCFLFFFFVLFCFTLWTGRYRVLYGVTQLVTLVVFGFFLFIFVFFFTEFSFPISPFRASPFHFCLFVFLANLISTLEPFIRLGRNDLAKWMNYENNSVLNGRKSFFFPNDDDEWNEWMNEWMKMPPQRPLGFSSMVQSV